MTNAKFTKTNNTVTVSYDDKINGRINREFFTRGAYVYEVLANGKDRQVCDRLNSGGSTLMHNDRPLADLICSEYRAMRRAEAREEAKY